MADILTPLERSVLMGRIRGVDTKPELFVRRALHALGYRFRVHVRSLPGTPDVVFSRRRKAVFVHGCFWHRHGCRKTYTPKSRKRFWQAKFAANIARDRRAQERLARDGWRIFVAWECEIEADDALLDRMAAFLGPPRTWERTFASARRGPGRARSPAHVGADLTEDLAAPSGTW